MIRIMVSKTVITNDFKQTQNLGFDLGKNLNSAAIFALFGNLGSGKTTFVQGLAKGLGIKQKIISPTFIIVRKYKLSSLSDPEFTEGESKGKQLRSLRQAQAKNFYHIDLYRIESENDLNGLGLEEILNDPKNVVAIEWPEKIEKILPEKRINLYFDYVDDNKRKIVVS